MKRDCSRCRKEFDAARTHWYCPECVSELNATVYKERIATYLKNNKKRISAQRAEYYQRMKKLRPPPVVYRTPRCQKIHEEPEKIVKFNVEFL